MSGSAYSAPAFTALLVMFRMLFFIARLDATLAMVSRHRLLVVLARLEVAVVVRLPVVAEVPTALAPVPTGLVFPASRFFVHLHLMPVLGFRVCMFLVAVLARERPLFDWPTRLVRKSTRKYTNGEAHVSGEVAADSLITGVSRCPMRLGARWKLSDVELP